MLRRVGCGSVRQCTGASMVCQVREAFLVLQLCSSKAGVHGCECCAGMRCVCRGKEVCIGEVGMQGCLVCKGETSVQR